MKAGIAVRLLVLLAIAALALSGCSSANGASAGQASATPAPTTPVYTAKLAFDPPSAQIGATVAFSGSGYTPGAAVDLVWHTVKGRYELQNGTEFVGQRYDDVSNVALTTQADASGQISGQLVVPNDFGGAHDVRGRVKGQEISQASLTIKPTITLSPSQGPIGTPIEVRIIGVDWRTTINTWHILYNNSYLGFMSAVTTDGVAVAHIRAAGPVGYAHVSVWHNSYNPTPYLNWQQSPYKDIPSAEFDFTVTGDPGPGTPVVEDFSASDNPWPVQVKVQGSGQLSASVDRGPVGQSITLQGSNLPQNASLTLRWWTMVGNRVSAAGFTEQSKDLGTIQTDANGAFTKAWQMPDDLGGQHRLELVQGDQVRAATGLVIEPSVLSISPTTVHAGEQVKIHLKGLGWTTYDNTYSVTYDDSYIGYVCGFSTNGDVQFTITATGGPGTHIIDLYPTIYKGQDPKPSVYSVPQLTYQDDHPQRITPAIRLAIEITD